MNYDNMNWGGGRNYPGCYPPQRPQPSGHRILLHGSPGGFIPVFLGSAVFEGGVHPCKIVPSLNPPCRVSYGGSERLHHGNYDLRAFDPSMMEWVPTSFGRMPMGRQPVEGGYEENGARPYHAMTIVNNIQVPSKTGEHLRGCNVPYGGTEHHVAEGYDIL